MYGAYDHGWMFGGGLGMILIWLIPLVLLFLLGRSFLAKDADRDKAAPPPRSALDLLKESYARGEIGRDEFLQKRDDLTEK